MHSFVFVVGGFISSFYFWFSFLLSMMFEEEYSNVQIVVESRLQEMNAVNNNDANACLCVSVCLCLNRNNPSMVLAIVLQF